MFSKLALFIAATMAVFVTASSEGDGYGSSEGGIANSCNTGEVQCCHSIITSKEYPEYETLFGILGISVEDLTGQVGLQCSPFSAIAIAQGSRCGTQPVCCDKNDFNGVLAMGCSPVSGL